MCTCVDVLIFPHLLHNMTDQCSTPQRETDTIRVSGMYKSAAVWRNNPYLQECKCRQVSCSLERVRRQAAN